jgi:hypothetical protein
MRRNWYFLLTIAVCSRSPTIIWFLPFRSTRTRWMRRRPMSNWPALSRVAGRVVGHLSPVAGQAAGLMSRAEDQAAGQSSRAVDIVWVAAITVASGTAQGGVFGVAVGGPTAWALAGCKPQSVTFGPAGRMSQTSRAAPRSIRVVSPKRRATVPPRAGRICRRSTRDGGPKSGTLGSKHECPRGHPSTLSDHSEMARNY